MNGEMAAEKKPRRRCRRRRGKTIAHGGDVTLKTVSKLIKICKRYLKEILRSQNHSYYGFTKVNYKTYQETIQYEIGLEVAGSDRK